MNKLIKIIKNLFYPVTLLTVIVLFCIILTIQALIIALTNDHTAAIYIAVLAPITLLVTLIYLVDRWLVKKVKYYQLMLGEIIIALFIAYAYLNPNSETHSVTEINFYTNQDFILIIFDANENSISKFTPKGTFGKKLDIYHTNIIHLDSTISLRKDLRINTPKQWQRFTTDKGKINLDGNEIEYIYSSENMLSLNYRKNTDRYLDSLIRNEKIK